MKVLFRTKWFSPDMKRHRANSVYNVPDEWKKIMPKSVVYLDEEDDVKEGPMTSPAIAKLTAKKAAKAKPVEAKSEIKL